MPTDAVQICSLRSAVDALAHERLPDDQRAGVTSHLESCAGCRAAFRETTAKWFPHVPNYTIVEQIGKGGFGVVYRAIHHEKQRSEALKVHFGQTPLRAAYFENEVHLIARLRHPNIATLYEANLSGDPPYYAMELVDGQQLDDYLKSSAASLADRIRLVRTVAAAVGYAHSQGVLHRDIKPQNIIVEPGGTPRIVDFGIGKRLGIPDSDQPAAVGSGRTEGALGTLGYIAPEQVAGAKVDARADVFALGALLYHCVTGDPARLANRVDRVTQRLRQRKVTSAEDLAAVIARCIEPDPARRYSSCAALIADLDNYLTSAPIAAREHRPLGYRFVRLAAYALRMHPFAVRGVVVAGVALLLTQLLWALNSDFLPGETRKETVLISFSDETRDHIRNRQIGADLPGLTADDPKSWRLLHGRLLTALGRGRPRAVVMDYFFPDCRPQFDPAFLAGIRALGAPLVVGSREFDINGEPRMCPAIRSAVHSVGVLSSPNPGSSSGPYVVTLAVLRGFGAPMPALAVAGFAAYRFPECEFSIILQGQKLELRYQRRATVTDQARWRTETDELPIHTLAAKPIAEFLNPGDEVAYGAVDRGGPKRWQRDIVPYEQVLAADDAQLRAWFEHRAVVIGQCIAGKDQYPVSDGQTVFGCQIHVLALDALLSSALGYPYSRAEVALRALGWCMLAGVAAMLASRLLDRVAIRWLAVGAALGFAFGTIAVAAAATLATTRWPVELGIAGASLLAAGAACLLIECVRRRQVQLAPGPTWSTEPSTLSSTLVADSRSTHATKA